MSVMLIRLLGEAALLLWGINTAQTSMRRAFGSDLKFMLGLGLQTRLRAFSSGLAVASVLPSSTTAALMLASLTTGGAVDLVLALSVMLGVNIGSTLIVQVFSLNISSIFPVLILGGFLAHRKGSSSRIRDLGQAAIGLGLMSLSLKLMSETLQPSETALIFKNLLAQQDRVLLVVLAGALGCVIRSSVAAVLLIMSLANAGLITDGSALGMVLGANVGTALIPLITRTGVNPAKLQIQAGNLLIRLVGCAVALPLIDPVVATMSYFEAQPARLLANFQTLLNLFLAALFSSLLPWIAKFLRIVLPVRIKKAAPDVPQHLTADAQNVPARALSNASQEVMRLADIVKCTLDASRALLHAGDLARVASVKRMDDGVDSLFSAIRQYLGSINHDALNGAETKHLSDILAFAVSLEHVGDIIDRNLMDLATKRIKNRLDLPKDSLVELDNTHARLLEHLQLAASVLTSQDIGIARRLVAEKEHFREIERAIVQRHHEHLRLGTMSADMSALQLDIVRDLKRIDSYLTATGSALLELSGELEPSRLIS